MGEAWTLLCMQCTSCLILWRLSDCDLLQCDFHQMTVLVRLRNAATRLVLLSERYWLCPVFLTQLWSQCFMKPVSRSCQFYEILTEKVSLEIPKSAMFFALALRSEAIWSVCFNFIVLWWVGRNELRAVLLHEMYWSLACSQNCGHRTLKVHEECRMNRNQWNVSVHHNSYV